MPEVNLTKNQIATVFVDKILAEKGLTDLSPEQQVRLREQLKAKLDEQVDQAMLRALSDEQLDELEKLIDDGASDEQIDDFFNRTNVDFTAAVQETMVEFRKAFLASGDEEK